MGQNLFLPKYVRFGDVVNLNIDRVNNPLSEGIERYIGLEHITPKDLRIRKWGYVSEGTTFTNYFKPGQVLFGKRRAYQRKVAVADFDGVCSGDIYTFETKDTNILLPEFLPFICQSERFYNYAVFTSAGSLSPRTNWNYLSDFEFYLPPLVEQHKIVKLLNTNLELMDSLLLSKQQYSQLIKSLGMDLFDYAINNSQTVKLSEIIIGTPQSGIYKPKSDYGHGTLMVHMGELFANEVINSKVQMQRVKLTEKEQSKFLLSDSDLLFGRRSIVLEGAGKCVLVEDVKEPISFESSIIRVTINSVRAINKYVFEWFNSPRGLQEIARIRTFTTVAGVKGSDVSRLKVPIPSLSIQKDIYQKLSSTRIGISLINQRMSHFKAFHSNILNNLIDRKL